MNGVVVLLLLLRRFLPRLFLIVFVFVQLVAVVAVTAVHLC